MATEGQQEGSLGQSCSVLSVVDTELTGDRITQNSASHTQTSARNAGET